MPRKKKAGINSKGRNKGGGQYLLIPYYMARTAAFRSLSGGALKVWLELRCRYDGSNNGKLSLSFQCAADLLGMSKTTVGRAFAELELKGFIKLKTKGQWYGRRAAEYIVTDRGFDGEQPTCDWKRWKPDAKSKKTKVGTETDRKSCLRPARVPKTQESFCCAPPRYSSAPKGCT